MPVNQRPPNPLPGSPLFDTYEAARAWVDQNRPKVPVCYYRQHGTSTYAVEELPDDHPLRRGPIVMTIHPLAAAEMREKRLRKEREAAESKDKETSPSPTEPADRPSEARRPLAE